MSEINIGLNSGESKRLLTGGKWCDRDILVTAAAAETAYTVYVGTAEPTADIGVDGDIYIVRSEA